MTKTLKMAFTGSAVLTPEYPDDFQPTADALVAVLPGGRHRRPPPRDKALEVSAQFAFVSFDYGQLVKTAADARDADHIYAPASGNKTGVCFLESEDWFVATPPLEHELSFDPSPAVGMPSKSSTGVRWIPRWSDFAGSVSSDPGIDPTVLQSQGNYVRVTAPAGTVSAGFVGEAPLISFDYGPSPDVRRYAHEIVVTMTYDEATQWVILRSQPFRDPIGSPATQPSTLTFSWQDSTEIKLLFGNGSLASILNAITGPVVGQDHRGAFDIDFAVLYDIMIVDPDGDGKLPLPKIQSFEVLKVPCVSTMAPTSGSGGTAANSSNAALGSRRSTVRRTK